MTTRRPGWHPDPDGSALLRQWDGEQKFPHWLSFCDKTSPGLDIIWRCLMPSGLSLDARARAFPERTNALLASRWLPPLMAACNILGVTESDFAAVGDRSMDYLLNGDRDV